MDIKQLKGEGLSIRAIARETGFSRNTVRRTLRERAPKAYHTPEQASCLDPFKAYIDKRYRKFSLSAVRIIEEIQPMGYEGSIRTLRRYMQTLRPLSDAFRTATVRFETSPGAQAQADWASCGHFVDVGLGRKPVHVFVMVMGFSRMMFVKFTSSMEMPTLKQCHMEAFEYFGGWTQRVLYDNMAQVRDPNTRELNKDFVDFCAHYGFAIKTHRPRRPRTKGKVERMVDYVKDNFLNGRQFSDYDDLNVQARHWLEHTANIRIHETTGRRPVDLFPEERLTPYCSIAPYRIYQRVECKVGKEGYVRFDRSRYSAGPAFVGRSVVVEACDATITIRSKDLIVAEYERSLKPGSCAVKPEHLQEMWKLCAARSGSGVPHWEQRPPGMVAVTDLGVYDRIGAQAELKASNSKLRSEANP